MLKRKISNGEHHKYDSDNTVDGILSLFHHIHFRNKSCIKECIHHCGGGHSKSEYTINHCQCGKHSIDKQIAVGHAWDDQAQPMEVLVRFFEKCPDGGWHVESGMVVEG
jgi:hypothetical protein